MQLAKTTSMSLLWVRKHREKDDAASMQLAIHTFRNTLLIAIFMGGLALQAAITCGSYYTTATVSFERVRLMIISVTLLLSFLSWASVIRTCAHLGYMTGVLSYHAPPTPRNTNANTSSRRLSNNNNTTTTITTNNNNAIPPSNASVDSRESDKDSNILIQEESKIMYIMLISFRLVYSY